MLIDRTLRRDLLDIKGRVVALVLIIAAGVGIFFGIRLALGNLLATQDALLDRMHFADLEVQLLPEDTYNLPDLSRLSEVEAVDVRLVFPGQLALSDGRALTTVMIFQGQPQPTLNRLELLAGSLWTPGAKEVVIDKGLADFHGYKPGDVVEIKVGNQIFRRTVAGVVMSAEFLVTSSNPEYVVAEPGSLGVVWGDIGDLRDSLGFTMVNSLLVRARTGTDPDRVLGAVAQAVRRLNVERIIPREESYSTKQVRMEVNAFGIYSPAIIVTLLVLSVAMGIITFRRFAVERMREFAVMKALGIRRRVMAVALLRLGVALGLLGGLVGLGIGWWTAHTVAEVYSKAMKLPLVIHQFDPALAAISLLLGVGSGVAAVAVSCLPMLNLGVRELMTERHRRAGDGPRFTGWPLMLRFSLRDLWRQRDLSLSSILAMGGAVGVAISYGLAMTSNFATVDATYHRDGWSFAVDFRYPLYADEIAPLLAESGAVRQQPYFRTATELRFGNRHAVAVLAGQVADGPLHRQHPTQGRDIAGPGEAVVSYDLMRDLGAVLGDRIRLEKGDQSEDIVVVGITNDIYLRTVTIGLGEAQDLSHFPEKVSGVYVDAAAASRSRLAAPDTVARVTDRMQLRDSLMKQMAEKMGIVYVTIVFAICVSVIFVTTLVHLGIAEKRGEYAVLLSLGFKARRIRGIILVGMLVQLGAALVVSVPVAVFLVQGLNARMGEAWYAVDAHYAFGDFALPMVCSLVVAPIVGLLGCRSVLKLNIPDFLRGRAI